MKNADIYKIITRALREDATNNDVTTNTLIPSNHISKASIISRESAIVCGLDIAREVFQKQNKHIRFQALHKDGTKVKANTRIATIKGKTRSLLACERVALNFLGYLSGIATNTRAYVQKAQRSKAKIFDTRKTTPGLRALEKYAVKCGGGENHRFDLRQMVLIKDNHREACQPQCSIPEAIGRIRRKTNKTLESEVDNLIQFRQALTASPDIILLDNMSCTQMKKAVELNRKQSRKKRPLLEASGGVTLRNVAAIARTGVDRISIGSLTHTRKAVDFSMELEIRVIARSAGDPSLVIARRAKPDEAISKTSSGQAPQSKMRLLRSLRSLAMTVIATFLAMTVLLSAGTIHPQRAYAQTLPTHTIFDDQMLLDGYTKKYDNLSKKTLLAMIQDNTLTPYRSAAAVKVFKEKYSGEVVSKEKRAIEKILLRRLHRTTSPFVQVEIMHTLCQMDRYRYFKSMMPALIQKLDHYNATVNTIAFDSLNQIIDSGNNRQREARIVFNTLRKILFLSRRRLADITQPDPQLTKKLKLLRWSIKILGNQELKKLPKEVINLL